MKNAVLLFCLIRLVIGLILLFCGGMSLVPNGVREIYPIAAAWLLAASIVSLITALIDAIIVADHS